MKAAFLNLAVQLGRFLGISIESEEILISASYARMARVFAAHRKFQEFYPILYMDCRILRFMLDCGLPLLQLSSSKLFSHTRNEQIKKTRWI